MNKENELSSRNFQKATELISDKSRFLTHYIGEAKGPVLMEKKRI